MPELPEIESLRRSLRPMIGSRVVRGCVHRADMVLPDGAVPLPKGARIRALHRHGKQLVLETLDHGCLVVHLGMSGSLRLVAEADEPPRDSHVHARWVLESPDGSRCTLLHRDPRRFGWLEVHPDLEHVRTVWRDRLGPDAMDPPVAALLDAFAVTRRAVKAVLLDQSVIAGIGNIYADEALFRARVHPFNPACAMERSAGLRLVKAIRWVLQRAIEHGGSTIRDHRTADGRWGSFQRMHRVYGRGGQPCFRCGNTLRLTRLLQRATVFCPACQPRGPGVRPKGRRRSRGLAAPVDG